MYKLITGKELFNLIDNGVIDALPGNVGKCSIDVRLSSKIKVEAVNLNGDSIYLDSDENIRIRDYVIDTGYMLGSGVFALAKTQEYFNLPENMTASFSLRSKMAQRGLNHALSHIIQPGWSGNLVLELSNSLKYNSLVLTTGLVVGQVQFFEI